MMLVRILGELFVAFMAVWVLFSESLIDCHFVCVT
jgi:hypothetical protein